MGRKNIWIQRKAFSPFLFPFLRIQSDIGTITGLLAKTLVTLFSKKMICVIPMNHSESLGTSILQQ